MLIICDLFTSKPKTRNKMILVWTILLGLVAALAIVLLRLRKNKDILIPTILAIAMILGLGLLIILVKGDASGADKGGDADIFPFYLWLPIWAAMIPLFSKAKREDVKLDNKMKIALVSGTIVLFLAIIAVLMI